MSKTGIQTSEIHRGPGLPAALLAERQDSPLLSNFLTLLYRLDYIKFNTMRFTFLKLPEGTEIHEAVEIAKRYCKKRSWSFSYLELAIVDLTNEEEI